MATAKELFDTFYRPLLELQCLKSRDRQVFYAKQRAIEHCEAMMKESEMIRKPEYTTFVLKYTTDTEISETADGYEGIAYYEALKAEIEKL